MQVHDRARKMWALLKWTGEGCSPSFLLSRCGNTMALLQTGAHFWVTSCQIPPLGWRHWVLWAAKSLKISSNIHLTFRSVCMHIYKYIHTHISTHTHKNKYIYIYIHIYKSSAALFAKWTSSLTKNKKRAEKSTVSKSGVAQREVMLPGKSVYF